LTAAVHLSWAFCWAACNTCLSCICCAAISAVRATAVGSMMTAGAADPSVGHGSLHIIEGAGGRHLLTGPASSTGDEKMSDAALSTQAAILKAVNTGRCVPAGPRAVPSAWCRQGCASTCCADQLHAFRATTLKQEPAGVHLKAQQNCCAGPPPAGPVVLQPVTHWQQSCKALMLIKLSTGRTELITVFCLCSLVLLQCQQGDNSWHPHDGGCHRSLNDTC